MAEVVEPPLAARLPAVGPGPTTLVSEVRFMDSTSAVADGDAFYVAEGIHLLRAPKSGGVPTKLTCHSIFAQTIAVDATTIYFNDTNRIVALPR